MLKNKDVLKKLFQSMMIPADEVVLSDEEIEAQLAQADAQQQEQQQALEMQQAQMAFEEQKLQLEGDSAGGNI
jgi:hypothetical protein